MEVAETVKKIYPEFITASEVRDFMEREHAKQLKQVKADAEAKNARIEAEAEAKTARIEAEKSRIEAENTRLKEQLAQLSAKANTAMVKDMVGFAALPKED
ncbi:hypothetical protein FACS1894188_07000 [Clostridia bacterium]|nr:hypothetical protein FACS1894188_07000 [Clostridia bacterium]